MHPVDALLRLGGVADHKTLRRHTSRGRLRTALRSGEVVKAGRGGYALPNADHGLRAGRLLNGVASHESAAAYHGWKVKSPPERPAVIVPRHRRVPPHLKRAIDVRYRSLEDHEHDGMATSKARTVIDCAKDLPFDRALAVADSALRSGDVTQDELLRLAAALPSNGRKQALRVAAEADGRADNPFESCLRAIALDVPGLRVEAQVDISEFGFECRPDLVDVERRIVIEADSFEFHSTRRSLRKDIERYTDLVALVEGPQTLATSPRTTRKSA